MGKLAVQLTHLGRWQCRYVWQGLESSQVAIQRLRQQGALGRGMADTVRGRAAKINRERWEKSLAGLTERFVELFVADGQSGTISLHTAAHVLSSKPCTLLYI